MPSQERYCVLCCLCVCVPCVSRPNFCFSLLAEGDNTHTIACSGWEDENSPLTYSFRYALTSLAPDAVSSSLIPQELTGDVAADVEASLPLFVSSPAPSAT